MQDSYNFRTNKDTAFVWMGSRNPKSPCRTGTIFVQTSKQACTGPFSFSAPKAFTNRVHSKNPKSPCRTGTIFVQTSKQACTGPFSFSAPKAFTNRVHATGVLNASPSPLASDFNVMFKRAFVFPLYFSICSVAILACLTFVCSNNGKP